MINSVNYTCKCKDILITKKIYLFHFYLRSNTYIILFEDCIGLFITNNDDPRIISIGVEIVDKYPYDNIIYTV